MVALHSRELEVKYKVQLRDGRLPKNAGLVSIWTSLYCASVFTSVDPMPCPAPPMLIDWLAGQTRGTVSAATAACCAPSHHASSATGTNAPPDLDPKNSPVTHIRTCCDLPQGCIAQQTHASPLVYLSLNCRLATNDSVLPVTVLRYQE